MTVLAVALLLGGVANSHLVIAPMDEMLEVGKDMVNLHFTL